MRNARSMLGRALVMVSTVSVAATPGCKDPEAIRAKERAALFCKVATDARANVEMDVRALEALVGFPGSRTGEPLRMAACCSTLPRYEHLQGYLRSLTSTLGWLHAGPAATVLHHALSVPALAYETVGWGACVDDVEKSEATIVSRARSALKAISAAADTCGDAE